MLLEEQPNYVSIKLTNPFVNINRSIVFLQDSGDLQVRLYKRRVCQLGYKVLGLMVREVLWWLPFEVFLLGFSSDIFKILFSIVLIKCLQDWAS